MRDWTKYNFSDLEYDLIFAASDFVDCVELQYSYEIIENAELYLRNALELLKSHDKGDKNE